MWIFEATDASACARSQTWEERYVSRRTDHSRIKGYVGRLADRREFRISHDLRLEDQEAERVLVRFSKPSTDAHTFSCPRLAKQDLGIGHEECLSRNARRLTKDWISTQIELAHGRASLAVANLTFHAPSIAHTLKCAFMEEGSSSGDPRVTRTREDVPDHAQIAFALVIHLFLCF